MVRVIQINENKAFLAAVHLSKQFEECPNTFALLTEPYLLFNKPAALPARTNVISSKDKPRAAIVTSRSLILTQIHSLTSRDCAVALATFDDKNLPLLIGADSNAHSTLFGSTENNRRGDEFEELIMEQLLKVENLGNSPTFVAPRGRTWAESHIDVTLTKNLKDNILDWRVDPSFNGSDHKTIYFQLCTNPVSTPPKR
jgi:hypothetical protein